jgi:flagellar hook-associated protein 2
MRISGLASGLDIEGMLEDIMRAERIPVDRLYRQKVKAEWKRDAYRDVNTKLLQLRTKAFDLRLQGSFSTRKVTSSNPSLVTATATGKAVDGTYEISVASLASSGRVEWRASEDVDVNAIVTDAIAEAGSDVEKAVIAFEGVDGNPVLVELAKNDTLASFAAKINSNKNLGLNAFYDDVKKQMVITTKATGASASVKLGEDTDAAGRAIVSELFGVDLDGHDFQEQAFVSIGTAGENAQLTINGLATERESNTFEINGVNITLHGPTEGTSPVRVTVERDVDAVYDRIKGFVDLYNEIITELNLKLREPVNRSYEPLTEAERDEMNEKDIERWETAAKSGLLRSDSIISRILSDMRMAISGSDLAKVGIKTGSWQEYGRLHIDETALKEAIAEDPDGVMEIFTRQDGGENVGLAGKLTKILDDGMERISSTAGKASMPYDTSYLGEQIRRYESRLEAMEDRLARVENRYWNQFIAMERALSELYAQSDWLYQQLAVLQG